MKFQNLMCICLIWITLLISANSRIKQHNFQKKNPLIGVVATLNEGGRCSSMACSCPGETKYFCTYGEICRKGKKKNAGINGCYLFNDNPLPGNLEQNQRNLMTDKSSSLIRV